MQTVVAPRTVRPETPNRWARALTRALYGGVEIFTTASGQRFATSATQHDMLYAVSETTCECRAAQEGDPICMHRAALRSILGTLSVLTLRIDELVPADAPRCTWCFGKGERWAGSAEDPRLITCPECQGTGHNLGAILRVA